MPEQIPQPNKKIEVIPPYEFRKGTKLSDEEKKALSDYLSGLTVEWKGNAKPREESGRRMFEISRLINNNLLWAKENLGLSLALKKRNISLPKIKFYDPEEFNKMAEAGEFSHDVQGCVITEAGDAVILEQKNERVVLERTNHELIHMLGRIVVDAKKRDGNQINFFIHKIGYTDERKKQFDVFSEAITEMINLESLAYYQKTTGTDYITGCKVGYFVAVIFFDMLIAKLAEKSGLSGQEIRKDLYTGYFTGQFKYLSLFNKHLGEGTLKKIAGLPKYVLGGMGTTESTEFLFKDKFKEAGLDYYEFLDKIERYYAGKEVKLYCGVEVSKNVKPSKI